MIETFHSLLRITVMMLSIVAITKYRHMFNRMERIGLSLAGGCGLLTIDVIWEQERSPFYGWIPMLFTLGVALFLVGLLRRKGRHDLANQAANREAASYLKARGKL